MTNEKVYEINNEFSGNGTKSNITFKYGGAIIKIKTILEVNGRKMEDEIYLMRSEFESIIEHYMSEKKGGE